MEIVTVAVFENPVKAHLDLVKLEDKGIEASLTGVDAFRSSFSGSAEIKLLVRDEDYARALEVLGLDLAGDGSSSGEVSLHIVGWVLLAPIVACSFLLSRLLFSIPFPEMAAAKDLVFVFIGPFSGLLAASSFAPKHKRATALLAFAICLGIAWNLK